MARWRAPAGAVADMSRTTALWLGEIEGRTVAVVDFHSRSEPFRSWLVEVTGRPGQLRVSQARDYPDRFPPDYQDLLVLRSPGIGPRYLPSARVRSVEGPGGEIAVKGGITDRVAVPPCAVSSVTVRLPADEQRRYLDLGTGGPPRGYPLLEDESADKAGEVGAVLREVDTCAAERPNHWLRSARGVLGSEPPSALVAAPDETKVEAGGLRGTVRTVQLLGGSAGTAKKAVAALWRPADGKPALSAALDADAHPPRVLTLTGTAQPMAVVTYPAEPGADKDSRITDVRASAPAATLADRPGVLVVRLPGKPVELTYRQGGAEKRLTITG